MVLQVKIEDYDSVKEVTRVAMRMSDLLQVAVDLTWRDHIVRVDQWTSDWTVEQDLKKVGL